MSSSQTRDAGAGSHGSNRRSPIQLKHTPTASILLQHTPPETCDASASSSGSNKSSPVQLKRSPTASSFYDCEGVLQFSHDPNSKDWHYAKDVRAQVKAAGPPVRLRMRGYPSYYGNKGDDPPSLSVHEPMSHVPILPGTSKPYTDGRKGSHRAVYNDKDRENVEVIYHDPKKPPPPGSKNEGFSKARYVPRASFDIRVSPQSPKQI